MSKPEVWLRGPIASVPPPSTVIGLLFHAAEHTQRHAGQIATASRLGLAASQSAAESRA